MNADTKIYYCQAGAHYWYYEDNDESTSPLFYAYQADCPAEDAEAAKDKYCGCNE